MVLSEDFQTEPVPCPYCDHLLDVAKRVFGKDKIAPKQGDWTVCISCAQPLVFGEDARVRKPRAGEIDAMAAVHPGLKQEIEVVVRAVRMLDRRPPAEQDRPLNRQQRRMRKRRQRRSSRHLPQKH
jgi:hypothetical protein